MADLKRYLQLTRRRLLGTAAGIAIPRRSLPDRFSIAGFVEGEIATSAAPREE